MPLICSPILQVLWYRYLPFGLPVDRRRASKWNDCHFAQRTWNASIEFLIWNFVAFNLTQDVFRMVSCGGAGCDCVSINDLGHNSHSRLLGDSTMYHAWFRSWRTDYADNVSYCDFGEHNVSLNRLLEGRQRQTDMRYAWNTWRYMCQNDDGKQTIRRSFWCLVKQRVYRNRFAMSVKTVQK